MSDEGVLLMLGQTGCVVGLLALRVDDTIDGVMDVFRAATVKVCSSLQDGAMEKDGLHYKGLMLVTH